MSGFGKRTRQEQPRQHASAPGQQIDPAQPDLISRRDLAQIEKGRMPPWANLSKMQLGGFLLLIPALVLAALWFYGPGVVRDLRHAGTFTTATDLRATDGDCRRHVFLVTLCSARLRSVYGAEPVRDTSFMMFFRSGDGVRMIPVRSTADPSVVGISYATSDVLTNRTVSLLGVTVFFAWLWAVFLGCIRKGRYKGGPAHQAVLQFATLRPNPA